MKLTFPNGETPELPEVTAITAVASMFDAKPSDVIVLMHRPPEVWDAQLLSEEQISHTDLGPDNTGWLRYWHNRERYGQRFIRLLICWGTGYHCAAALEYVSCNARGGQA